METRKSGYISTSRACAVKTVTAVVALINIILAVEKLTLLKGWVFYCVLLLCCACFVLTVLPFNVKSAIYKTIIIFTAMALVLIVTFILLNEAGALCLITDVEALRKLISDSGIWGYAILFLITIFEVVVLPIPAAVTILIGTVLYGAVVSFFVSSLGMIVGSAICYYIGKSFGYGIVEWIAGEENTKKYAKIIGEKGKIPFFAMMLLPLFPDDLLCMLAGVTRMSRSFYFLTIAFTRPVSVAFYSFFGSGEIIPFSGRGIPIWIGIFAALGVLLYFINVFVKRKFIDEREKNKKSK